MYNGVGDNSALEGRTLEKRRNGSNPTFPTDQGLLLGRAWPFRKSKALKDKAKNTVQIFMNGHVLQGADHFGTKLALVFCLALALGFWESGHSTLCALGFPVLFQ